MFRNADRSVEIFQARLTIKVTFTYLLVNLFSISVPLAFSFDKRLNFYKSWKYLFPAIIITAIFFIVWDSIFTQLGVWGFNPKYTTGIKFFNLPLEEYLFFFCIPYACMFTYVVVNYFVKEDILEKYVSSINLFLILSLSLCAIMFHERLYTFYTSLFTAIFLMLHQFVLKDSYLGRAYLSYLIILIPFFITNGILTGTGLDEPVVWYNDSENLSMRLLTVPVEDTFYGLLMFLINVTLYERFRGILPPRH